MHSPLGSAAQPAQELHCSRDPCLEINNQPSTPPACLHLHRISLPTSVQINLDPDPVKHSNMCSILTTVVGGAERWGDSMCGLSLTLAGMDAEFIPVYLLMDSSNHVRRRLVSPARLIPRGRAVQTQHLCSPLSLVHSSLSLLDVLLTLSGL